MVNEQLVSWLRENQSKGFDLETLKGQLLQSGHNEVDIDEAVNAVGVESATAAQPSEVGEPESSELKTKLPSFPSKKIVLSSIIGIVGIIFLIFFLTMGGEETSQKIAATPELPEEVVEDETVEEVTEEVLDEELVEETFVGKIGGGPTSENVHTFTNGESKIIDLNGVEYEVETTIWGDGDSAQFVINGEPINLRVDGETYRLFDGLNVKLIGILMGSEILPNRAELEFGAIGDDWLEFDKIVGDSCSESSECSDIDCGEYEEDWEGFSPFCHYGRCYCEIKGIESSNPPCDNDSHCEVFGEEECYADDGEVASCIEQYNGQLGCECVV